MLFLIVFGVLSIAIILLDSLVLQLKVKKQVEYANIIRKMSVVQLIYTKSILDGIMNKYPNIKIILENTVHILGKTLEHKDFDYKGITVHKGIMPGLDIDKLAHETMSCPPELRKAMQLNSDIVMRLSKIKRPLFFWQIRIKLFLVLLPIRILACFPNNNSKKTPKVERKMIENIKQEIATVGIQ